MAVRLSALRTGRAVLPRNIFFCFWYLFLLEAEWTPGPSATGRIRWIEENSYTSSGLEPATSRLVAPRYHVPPIRHYVAWATDRIVIWDVYTENILNRG
jgi:hypothetical protein